MLVYEIEGLLNSAGSINKYCFCDYKWFLKYIIKAPTNPQARTLPIRLGNRIHSVEETTWDSIRKVGMKCLSASFLKSVDKEEMAKQLTSFKKCLLFSRESSILKYLHNISLIDASQFIDLREYFDGDVEQAFGYLVPVTMEFSQKNFKSRSHIIIDNISIIPKRFKNYMNKDECLLLKDYKPGHFKDGLIKPMQKLGDYDYGGDFARQMTHYADNLVFPEEFPMKTGYVAGIMYKTGQYIVDKIDGRNLSPLRKKIDELMSKSHFQRRNKGRPFWKNGKMIPDKCDMCEYSLFCRDTVDLVSGKDNGSSQSIAKYCKKVVCRRCREIFKVPKHSNKKICLNCEIKNTSFSEASIISPDGDIIKKFNGDVPTGE